MSKYVVFSFDDGRLDTYVNAVPIMEKYGLTATINITTDFISNPNRYTTFKSADNKAMSVDQVRELYQRGFEIASHGNRHINDPDDVRRSIDILHTWGIDKVYGFASPESAIDYQNFSQFENLVKDGTLTYIRSGLQVRKQGLNYAGFYVMQNLTKSGALFYHQNKKLIQIGNDCTTLEFGISVSQHTTVEQIMYLINRMPENASVVFIFHSILKSNEPGTGADKWYWEKERFEKLCSKIEKCSACQIINNSILYR